MKYIFRYTIVLILFSIKIITAQTVNETKVVGNRNKIKAEQSSPASATIKQDIKGNLNDISNYQKAAPDSTKTSKKPSGSESVSKYVKDNALTLIGLLLALIPVIYYFIDRKKNSQANGLVPLLALLSASSFGQQPKNYSNQSKVEIKGSKNQVNVVQGGTLITYNLLDANDTQKLVAHLRTIPSIVKQLNQLSKDVHSISNQNELLINLAKNGPKEGYISIDDYNKTLEKYIIDNNNLKNEIKQLKLSSRDETFSLVLIGAENKLKELDNEGYQNLLEEFKRKRKEKLQREVIEIAEASYLQSLNNFNQFHYTLALRQIEESIEYDHKNQIYVIIKGNILTNLYRLPEALETYLSVDAKKLDENIKGTFYNQLGLTYFYKGDYVNSIQCFENALAIHLASLGQNHPQVAAIYTNIGAVKQANAKYDQAIEYYQKALSIYISLFGENNYHVATTYNNIGVAYYSFGDFNKAIEYYNKNLQICLNTLGDKHPNVASTYGNLGISFADKQDFDTAYEYYNKAILILNQIFGDESAESGLMYNNIGSLYYAKRDYKEAIIYFEKALKINLKAFGPNHQDVALIYSNLGEIYRLLENFDKAMSNFKLAESIYVSNNDETPNAAMVYNNLGMMYYFKHDMTQSLHYHNKALSIRRKALREDHPDMALSYSNFASVHYSMGNNEMAINDMNKALNIQSKIFGISHPATQNTLASLGIFYIANRNHEKGLYFLEKYTGYNSITIIDKINFFNNQGMNAFKERAYKSSIEFYNVAIKLLEENKISNEEEILPIVHHNLAKSLCIIGDFQKATIHFKRAEEICQATNNINLIRVIADSRKNCKKL